MSLFQRLKTFIPVAATAVTIGYASDVSATTLATFDIDGKFSYVTPPTGGGSEFTISGDVLGDASSAGDTSLVQPLVLSASLEGSVAAGLEGGPTTPIASGVVFDVATPPIPASLDDLLFAALLFGDFIISTADPADLAAATDLFDYLVGNTGDPYDLNPGYSLEFTYGGSIVGPILDGDFTLKITSDDTVDPLAAVVNSALIGEMLPPLFPSVPFVGTYSASFAITAVPLPATLPMLAVGGLALFGVARRKKITT